MSMKTCEICKQDSFCNCRVCLYCGTVFPKMSEKTKKVLLEAERHSPEKGYHVPRNYQDWKRCRKPWYDAKCDKESLIEKGKNASAWLLDGEAESFIDTHKDAGFIVQRPTKTRR